MLDEYSVNEQGSTLWKCRCRCKTEKMVLARSLKSGASQSCGCMRREQELKKKDLTGRVFGDLTAVRPTDGSYNRWVCRCAACGGECESTRRRLLEGKKTHCGCKTRKDAAKKDITGQRFRMLTALYETDKRDYKGSVIWHCRCDCGNEVDLSYNSLNYSDIVSCGCHKRAVVETLRTRLTHVAGTSVDILKSKKNRKPNSSGVKGVYLIRGKYRAEICFQQKIYYLGTYSNLETAAQVRSEAEQLLHKNFIQFYDRWKQKADADPVWGEENPISVSVKKQKYGEFQILMQPNLEE